MVTPRRSVATSTKCAGVKSIREAMMIFVPNTSMVMMVYSGLDLGFCLAAPVFGYMLDHHMNAGVFYGAAVGMVLSVVSAGFVGAGVAARKAQLGAAKPA